MSTGKDVASIESPSWFDSNTVVSSTQRETMFSFGGSVKQSPKGEVKSDDWLAPYRMVHRALRGRYIFVVTLGLLGAVLGGWAGWRSQKPLFRSEGVIRIAYVTRPVLKETDLNGPLAMFDAFMQSQRLLLTSRRLLDMALTQPAWQATGLGASPAVIGEFASNLKVEYIPRTEHLRILYTGEDPTIAAAAVNSIISAYESVYKADELQFQQKRDHALEQERKRLTDRLKEIEALIEKTTGGVPASNLERLEEAAAQKLVRLSARLADIRLALALAEKQDSPKAAIALTPRQIAMADPVMRSYLTKQANLQEELDQLRLHLGESHRKVIETQRALDAAEAQVTQYANDYRNFQSSVAANPEAVQMGVLPLGSQSVEVLRDNEAIVSKLHDQAKEEVTSLGKRRQEVEKLIAEAQQARSEIAEVTQRIEVLKVEASLSGRLEVISKGEVPLAPFMDRRQRMGAVGAFAGLCLPVGLFMAVALASSRYRFSDETETDIPDTAPLLGIVPKLPDCLHDPEQAAMAAQCMHQVRAMLQVSKPHDSKHLYMVTSATSGEGKTSVTVALGLSFAASGSRTLLIDCDMVGQRLTRGFKAEHMSGVREALASGTIKGFVHRTNAGVYLLSAGRADATDACAMSSANLRQLLGDASASFDVVLIDTGPVLGSVEPLLIAPLIDGVILTIARGQERPLVERTMRQLRMAGARIAGFIFNRAERRDFHRSAQGSSVRSNASPNLPVRTIAPAPNDSSNFGPLVHSVASFLPGAS